MALMLGKLHAALIAANVPDDAAREAAEEAAEPKGDLATMGERITRLEGKIDKLVWMVGINVAMTLAILFRVFWPSG